MLRQKKILMFKMKTKLLMQINNLWQINFHIWIKNSRKLRIKFLRKLNHNQFN